ncbi:MAG: hypothetical protein HY721_23635 [Planctomycetes bacterium]|nr:hypothetical protein [Planctomycetota bacterium]
MLNAFLPVLALALGDAGEAAEKKPVLRTLRVQAVNAKTHRIDVKEPGFEVVWEAGKTQFLGHRSVPLKDLEEASRVLVFGKGYQPGFGGPPGKDQGRGQGKGRGPGGGRITDVELVGAGAAFVKPSLESKVGGMEWVEGKLAGADRSMLEVDRQRYRLAGAEKLTAYSVERLDPEKLVGAKVLIRGAPRKVTIERDGKAVEVTRLTALEVHLVELSAEHAKVFQTHWVEGKKAGPAAADKPGKAAGGTPKLE